MERKITISLLIPVYNVEEYLMHCFESVKRQNMMNYVEVIIVDDGSTDKSGAMCDSFASKLDNVKVYHQKNMGIAYTRNKLLEYAKGDYIAWLDSDDLLSAEWYESISSLLKYNPDLILFNLKQFEKDIPVVKMSRDFKEISTEDFFYKFSIGTEIQSHLCTKVFKRSLWVDSKFKRGMSYCEDFQILTKILLNVKKIISTDDFLYLYRFRNDSITRNKIHRGENSRIYLRLINLRYHFLKKRNRKVSRIGVIKAFVDYLYQSKCDRVFFLEFFYNNFMKIMLCDEIDNRHKVKAFIVFIKKLARQYQIKFRTMEK